MPKPRAKRTYVRANDGKFSKTSGVGSSGRSGGADGDLFQVEDTETKPVEHTNQNEEL